MTNKQNNLPIIIAIAVVAVVGAFSFWFFQNSQNTTPAVVTLPKSTSPSDVNQPEALAPKLGNSMVSDSDPNSSTAPDTTTTTSPTTPTTTTPVSGYKNGKFSADGSYTSPAGSEKVGVELTITDNKISDVIVTAKATDSKSIRYQGLFAEGIKGVIVGKSLDENLDPGDVNGSSLTGRGFVQAAEIIKQQAKL